MDIRAISLSIFLSLFSTIVMSYVALATPIGPWIAPTLVFISLLCARLCIKISSTSIAYAVSAGSVGGILATACAFSFPTIYFLDSSLFNEWMQSSFFFSSMLGIFSFLAGIFGFLIADLTEQSLIYEQNLSFPVGQLIHKMIAAQNQIRKAYELMLGFCAAVCFSFLQEGFLARVVIPKTITVVPALQFLVFSVPRFVINLDIAPMIWAIGFVTGHVIALPLAVGALSNIFFAGPVQRSFFSYVSPMEFTLAFCSGIVLFITLISLIDMSKRSVLGVKNGLKKLQHTNNVLQIFNARTFLLCCVIAIGLCLFLCYFRFPWYVQLYLVVCSAITSYQIAAIAGRIGLALLGRFATFVMVPAMLIFNLTYVHLVFIATFVEMSGGVAADILFGRKLAQLSDISHADMRKYQLLGLCVASATIGIIFWLFINYFGLGSPELFAYRAQSRQLLIQAKQFNVIVVGIGALFGFFLQQLSLNPMLVLGGFLMPLDMTCGLVFGGLLAALSSDKEAWYPLWSGIFAGNSICMLVRALCFMR